MLSLFVRALRGIRRKMRFGKGQSGPSRVSPRKRQRRKKKGR